MPLLLRHNCESRELESFDGYKRTDLISQAIKTQNRVRLHDRNAPTVARSPSSFCAAWCGWWFLRLLDEIIQCRQVVLFVQGYRRDWTRPKADAHETSWGWQHGGGQDTCSTTGWLSKIKQIIHSLCGYWSHQFVNENCYSLFHNYCCVCCQFVSRSQWVCCTQLLNLRFLCLHLEVHCFPIFAIL